MLDKAISVSLITMVWWDKVEKSLLDCQCMKDYGIKYTKDSY